MKVLVTGGTGMVGSAVVQALQGKADLSVLTRDVAKAKNLPAGVRGVVGNFLDVGTIRSAFKGFDSVFLINTVSPTEAAEGLMAVNGIRDAGVKRIVYVSVQDADVAVHLPHFGCKYPVELAIQKSGMSYTILRPNNFYQNDIWFRTAILDYGTYPQPIGSAGLNRVDIRDIADAAVAGLIGSKADRKVVTVAGPDILTGPSSAEAWSKALGRPVRYGGDDLDGWEQQNLSYGMPAAVVYDFKLMYAWFQKNGLKATRQDIDQITAILGHAPRRYTDFVAETATAWK